MINFSPEWITLSSHITNVLVISSSLSEVHFAIYDGRTTIYETTLYPVRNSIMFYGLQDIIMEYMERSGKNLVNFTLTTPNEVKQEENHYVDVLVLYSKVRPSTEYDGDFVESHFLTSRSYYMVPRDFDLSLGFVSKGDVQNVKILYDCVFNRNGAIWHFRHENMRVVANRPTVYLADVIHSSIVALASAECGGDPGTLLSVTVTVGKRTMPVYFIDNKPDMRFHFSNAFGLSEEICIFGTTKLKTEIDSKEAVCNGVASQYDRSSVRLYEVETAPMTIEDAEYMNEFLECSHIVKMIPPDRDEEILIEDISSEISDSGKDLIKIKFTWKYADNSRWKVIDDSRSRFQAPYNNSFK